jgi:hypothetical protein
MTDHRNGFDHVRTLFCLDWRRRTYDWIDVISLSARAHTAGSTFFFFENAALY